MNVGSLAWRLNVWAGTYLGVRLTRGGFDRKSLNRILYLHRLVQRIERLAGDVVECGVATGGSFAILAAIIRAYSPRRLWGYDNFAGLPKPAREDLDSSRTMATVGRYYSTEKRVYKELAKYGFTADGDLANIRLIRGLLHDTLPHHEGDSIALLHIDVDLYQSYLDCLTILWPKIVVGGIIALDEYHKNETWPGAKKAVDEFLRSMSEDSFELCRDDEFGWWYIIKNLPTGTGSVSKK